MKRCDTKKVFFQIKTDSIVVTLSGLGIYVEIAKKSEPDKVLKKFKSPEWSGSEEADLLPIDTENNSFALYLTAADIDLAECGDYDVHVWWEEADADFPGSSRRRFAQLENQISIIDD